VKAGHDLDRANRAKIPPLSSISHSDVYQKSEARSLQAAERGWQDSTWPATLGDSDATNVSSAATLCPVMFAAAALRADWPAVGGAADALRLRCAVPAERPRSVAGRAANGFG
jgi:hypothetical protein